MSRTLDSLKKTLSDPLVTTLLGALVGVLIGAWMGRLQWKNEQIIKGYTEASVALEDIFTEAGTFRERVQGPVKLALNNRDTSRAFDLLEGPIRNIAKAKGYFDIHSVVIGKLSDDRDSQAVRWRIDLGRFFKGLSAPATINQPEIFKSKQDLLDTIRVEVFEAAKADIGKMKSFGIW